MPELGGLDAKAVASLAGLAPVTRQSGAWQGRSFIQGGRARARRLLYMPALAAICYNPDLRAKYGQLVAQGKPRKVAVVAVMRKLLVLANVLLGEDRRWLPERLGGAARTRRAARRWSPREPSPVYSGLKTGRIPSSRRPSEVHVRSRAGARAAR